MEDGSTKKGYGIVGILTIIFIVLKILDVIKWSWIWVLSPIWISFSFSCLIILIIFIFIKKEK